MLCDDIIRRGRARVHRFPEEAAYCRTIGRMIEGAERFVLDSEAIEVILNVEESFPSRLLSALDMCRLPFPVMWVEYDLLHRMKEQVKYGYPLTCPPKTRRLSGGLLICATDDTMRRGIAYSCSATNLEPDPIINPVSFVFDWTEPEQNTVIPVNQKKYSVGYGNGSGIDIYPPDNPLADNDYTRKFRDKPDEVAALGQIEQSYKLHFHPDAHLWMQCLEKLLGQPTVEMHFNPKRNVWSPRIEHRLGDADDFRRFLFTCCSDWGGEKRWMIGLMLLLNTRNLVEYENRSVRQQNQGRSPRSLPALVSHRVVKIHLTKVAQNRASAQGITQGAMRWHKVRGHWKVRKTGVFFWRPHARGDLSKGVSTHEYHVTR
jgi:hypothetical protein